MSAAATTAADTPRCQVRSPLRSAVVALQTYIAPNPPTARPPSRTVKSRAVLMPYLRLATRCAGGPCSRNTGRILPRTVEREAARTCEKVREGRYKTATGFMAQVDAHHGIDVRIIAE